MIKLKSGKIVELSNDFDNFFQLLSREIISEAVDSATSGHSGENAADPAKILLKELMDQSIYVTHQLFELASHNERLAKFMVTGFVFNALALSIPDIAGASPSDKKEGDTFH